MADTTCGVCVEKYTKVERAQIACSACQYVACAACQRKYILGSTQDAHCMSCKQPWTRDFLAGHFPSSFLNGDYKKQRERILLDRELSLMPESQYIVDNYRKAQETRTAMNAKLQLIGQLKRQYHTLMNQTVGDRLTVERLSANNYRGNIPLRADAVAECRARIVGPCPANECRGFLGHTYKCGVCDIQACSKCGVVRAEDHVCVENDVASFTEVKNSTRPCPKCHAR